MDFKPGELKDEPLVIAARYNDALGEEIGLQETIEQAGLNFDKLLYLAEQRALRVVMIEQGLKPSELSPTVPLPGFLSPEARKKFTLYTSAYLDGMMIGWVGHRLHNEANL